MDNQKPKHVKLGFRIFIGVIVIAAVFLVGVNVGYANRSVVDKITGVSNKEAPATVSADFSTFWKAWQIVNDKYVSSDKVTDKDKVYGAIKGLLASYGDPYTTFFTPEENKVFQTEIAGEFSGIGIEMGQKDGILTVIAPLKDTPAEKAGIKAGDKIIKIDTKITTDMTIDQAIDLIRGAEGTPVTLTIIREGDVKSQTYTINRAKITLPTVETEVQGDVFIIHLYNFSAQSPELFRKALVEYLNSGKKNLLLDLRGNPGGYLEAAVTIGGWFVPEGKTIVKEIGKDPSNIDVHTSKGPTVFPKSNKLVVLVDKGSASAAEILAGALSEQGIGTLAGEKTFGKGSVQEVIKLTSDTSMKVTVAKWYTPNGVSISESGLTPKVQIPYVDDKSGKDNQLSEALKLFK